MKSILKRAKEPTPRFFKKLRNAGLLLAAISTTLLTAPVTLPTVVIQMASYLAVASSVASAVSQTAVKGE